MRTKRTSKIATALAAGGILMVAIAGQSQAADGGTNTCAQNGGSTQGCHLYHIKLKGKNRCVIFTPAGGDSFHVCRKNSMNVYLDPHTVSSVTVNVATADEDDSYTLTNNQNSCFRLTQGGRSVESRVPGIYIWENYDKLQLATQGAQCNSK
jgi:hypothetical protein